MSLLGPATNGICATMAHRTIAGSAMTSVDDACSVAPTVDEALTFNAFWGDNSSKGAFCF